jgi:sulfide:quinone oxidoreductase
MAESPLRVLIAGGGVAGLETLTALHSLAGDRVELTLLAPDDQFVYRPLAVEEPFAVKRAREVSLLDAARDAEASFVSGTIQEVETDTKIVNTSEGERLEYDALVLAVGAKAEPAVEHAMTWDDRSDVEMLGGLTRDIEEGYAHRVAVVIPPGPAWPLRGYELALLITLQGKSMSAEVETTIVAPEPSPLEILGSGAAEDVSKELEQAGVDVVSTDHADVEPGHTPTVVLHPSERRLEVDRVLALPALQGRPVPGIPADPRGFIDVDEHCRVRGVDSVWAVGDVTSFPLNSGGFAAEEADVAAEDIAAAAGAAVEPRAFDPVDRGELAGLPNGSFLKEWLATEDDGVSTNLPAFGVPALTYLQRDLEAGWRG